MTSFRAIYTSQTEFTLVKTDDSGVDIFFGPSNREYQELTAYVQGLGQTRAQWLAVFAPPAPTVREQGLAALLQVSSEYTTALMVLNEFGDATRMNAVKAKIATWKNAHPGVIP